MGKIRCCNDSPERKILLVTISCTRPSLPSLAAEIAACACKTCCLGQGGGRALEGRISRLCLVSEAGVRSTGSKLLRSVKWSLASCHLCTMRLLQAS